MEVTIRLKEKDLFSFNLYHSYHRAQTWLFTILGVVITVLSFTTYQSVELMYSMLYFACGMIFIFYTPLNLRTSAKMAFKRGGAISQSMKYRFNEQGIFVSLASEANDVEEDTGAVDSITWDLIFKVVETKKAVLIYTSPKNASILPKEQLGTNLETLREIFRKELEPFKYGH